MSKKPRTIEERLVVKALKSNPDITIEELLKDASGFDADRVKDALYEYQERPKKTVDLKKETRDRIGLQDFSKKPSSFNDPLKDLPQMTGGSSSTIDSPILEYIKKNFTALVSLIEDQKRPVVVPSPLLKEQGVEEQLLELKKVCDLKGVSLKEGLQYAIQVIQTLE
jgi:hypothetical protein